MKEGSSSGSCSDCSDTGPTWPGERMELCRAAVRPVWMARSAAQSSASELVSARSRYTMACGVRIWMQPSYLGWAGRNTCASMMGMTTWPSSLYSRWSLSVNKCDTHGRPANRPTLFKNRCPDRVMSCRDSGPSIFRRDRPVASLRLLPGVPELLARGDLMRRAEPPGDRPLPAPADRPRPRPRPRPLPRTGRRVGSPSEPLLRPPEARRPREREDMASEVRGALAYAAGLKHKRPRMARPACSTPDAPLAIAWLGGFRL